MNLSTRAILLYSLLGGTALIYFPYIVVVYGRLQVGYDFFAPRAMFDKLPDYAKRATWAHQNAFESFIVYAPAATIAYITGVDSKLAFGCVMGYLIARFLYPLFYISNIASARSLTFGIGSISSMVLYALSFLQIN